jgi:hypothetical protein
VRNVEATHGASTWGNSHQRLGHFFHFLGAHPGDKHLRYSLRYLRDVSTVAIKNLGMKVPLSISGHFEIFDRTR